MELENANEAFPYMGQRSSVAPGEVIHGFDQSTHSVHCVVTLGGRTPHAITDCGQDIVCGTSTMAMSRSDIPVAECSKCLSAEATPDIAHALRHHTGHVYRVLFQDGRPSNVSHLLSLHGSERA